MEAKIQRLCQDKTILYIARRHRISPLRVVEACLENTEDTYVLERNEQEIVKDSYKKLTD